MAINAVNLNTSYPVMTNFSARGKEISYGYLNLQKSNSEEPHQKPSNRTKILALLGSTTGAAIPLITFMKKQKAPNIFHVKYNVTRMLTMAACANAGGISLSSIGEKKKDIIKKWKEGAFQMSLTSLPMLLVDEAIKLCEKSKNPKINNNIMKIIGSVIGVSIGSNTAIFISNKLRNNKEAQKPKRELKLIDMIANLDDAVAICVLARIPFADKIHIERALPFIYSFCGFRSGTGDKK